MINALFAVFGLLVGGLINILADDLPERVRPKQPHCPRCGYKYGPAGWLAISRFIRGGECPQCGLPTGKRYLQVEIGTAILFFLLPWFFASLTDLVLYSIYIALLILIIVIDIEHLLILQVVIFPSTIFALIASVPLTDNNPVAAIVGAIIGFGLFYLAFLIGEKLFGVGALGFGDVTLAMLLGAMLGVQRVPFALLLALVLGGVWGGLALILGRINRHGHFAYGPFLALAGILMIIGGGSFVEWFMNR